MMNKTFIVLFIQLFATLVVQSQELKESPNVVFIISDQHQLEATGTYGSKIAITPNIDKLAETGIKFTNCYTPAPVCAPARASLMTGMYPYANGAIYHKAPVRLPNGKTKNLGSGYLRSTGYKTDIKTLAEIFREKGYSTAAPGKMHVHGELQANVDTNFMQGNDMGFDEISVRYYTNFPGGHYEDEVGQDTYMRYRQFEKYKNVYPKASMHLNQEYVPSLVLKDEDNFDMVVARKSVEFIEQRADDGKPFFLHVGFEKPHAPFTTTQKYLDMYNPEDFELPDSFDAWYKQGKFPWTPNWIHSGIPKNDIKGAKNVMAAYHACITQMDDMVGRVITALKENNLYENTIIIYTTDHGEHLFKHGLRGKHNMLEAAVNVPFILSYPKFLEQGIVNHSLISFIDIMPTLAEMIHSEVPKSAQGISLVNTLKNNLIIENRTVFSEFRGADYNLLPKIRNVPSRMMRKGDFKFVYTHGVIDQLYNLKDDPDELNNLIFKEAYSSVYQMLKFQTLAGWNFEKYQPISVKLDENIISWSNTKHYNNYSIFYAKENNPEKASLVQKKSGTVNYKLPQPGFYWVLAETNLTKTSKFYGNDIPVAVKDYTYTLPISTSVKY